MSALRERAFYNRHNILTLYINIARTRSRSEIKTVINLNSYQQGIEYLNYA